MTILLRLRVQGKTVSILETAAEIDIEVCGAGSQAQKKAIQEYIIEEGILDEVLAGNPQFPQTKAEDLLAKKE
jgi:hypothetical protein